MTSDPEVAERIRARSIVVLVGNPKAESKTLGVAVHVAEHLQAAATGRSTIDVIDLAEHSEELFDWTSASVGDAVARVKDADLLIVASPVYKATYAGILKVFCDRIAGGALGGVLAVPVMVGGAPAHALAVEVHLRPLLVELGATCVTPGLFVLEADIAQLHSSLELWAPTVLPLVSAALDDPVEM